MAKFIVEEWRVWAYEVEAVGEEEAKDKVADGEYDRKIASHSLEEVRTRRISD
jgi:hypothetical protein